MEIFVREKEINFKKILNNVGLSSDTKVITHTIHFMSDKPFGEEGTDTILASTTKTEVKSLEQHDRELLEELEVYKESFNMQLELILELKQKSPETAIEVMERYKLLELIRRENEQLKHELEVYKRALELASQTIQEMLGRPLVMGGSIANKLAFTPKDAECFLEEARKELEDEK